MKGEELHSTAKREGQGKRFSDLLKAAIEEKQIGECERYNSLLKVISEGKVAEDKLKDVIDGCRSCVSYFNKDYETLVGAILKIDWASRNDDVVDAYVNFITELVSAHTFYLRGCLKMLLQKFMPTFKVGADLNAVKLSDYDKQFENVHKAMVALVNIVPTAPRHLLIKISDFFPYIGKHQVLLQAYIRNLFNITRYMPSLQEKILEVVIDNLLHLDVQISKEELEEEEEVLDNDHDDMQFDVEIENDIKNHEELKKSDTGEMKHNIARKLDNLMLTVFEFIHQVCFTGENVNWGKAEELYIDLLRAFEMVLLPTHASAYVQFVMFYICSLGQYYANTFLEFCWQKVCDPNVPVILRQASSAYIGSFIARAKYIPGNVVQTCLELFSDWIHSYLNVLDSCVYPDLEKHATFYSVCQTLFYVFVFRFKSIEEDHDWRAKVKKMNLDRIVTCRLNPLKFCATAIVDMFARLTRKYEIVFCYTIIEHNKRSVFQSVVHGNQIDRKNILGSFFPFDPYLLKKSSRFIAPLYQEWTGIDGNTPGKNSDQERDSNDNHDVNNSKQIEDVMMHFSISPRTPRFDFCISPGFHPDLIKSQPISEE